MVTNLLQKMFGVSNVVIPKEGPKCIRATLEFDAEPEIDIQQLLATQNGLISFIQGVFIDNSANSNQFTLQCGVTNQRVVAPPNSQGFYPPFLVNSADLVATTTPASGLDVVLFFYNVPVGAHNWTVTASGGGSGMSLAEYETTLRGAFSSAEAVATGAQQTLAPANANRNYLLIQSRIGNAGNVSINLAGGTAADGIELIPGGSVEIPAGFAPTNAVTAIGTLGDTYVVVEG